LFGSADRGVDKVDSRCSREGGETLGGDPFDLGKNGKTYSRAGAYFWGRGKERDSSKSTKKEKTIKDVGKVSFPQRRRISAETRSQVKKAKEKEGARMSSPGPKDVDLPLVVL